MILHFIGRLVVYTPEAKHENFVNTFYLYKNKMMRSRNEHQVNVKICFMIYFLKSKINFTFNLVKKYGPEMHDFRLCAKWTIEECCKRPFIIPWRQWNRGGDKCGNAVKLRIFNYRVMAGAMLAARMQSPSCLCHEWREMPLSVSTKHLHFKELCTDRTHHNNENGNL